MPPSRTDRICRFEQMEPRQLLAADLTSVAIQLPPAIEPPPSEPGIVQAATDIRGSIAGHVALSVEDSGLEGVALRLLGETGNLLDVTQTDVAGDYQFANLSPGIYAVLEIQPADILDGSAHIGSGGGVVFDSNLIGEIVVHAGNDWVGYDFSERLTEEPAETGGEVNPPIAHHSGVGSQGEETRLADAALWQLYGSPSASLPQNSLPWEAPVITSGANYQPTLPTTLTTPPPFFGSFTHAEAQPVTGDGNGEAIESSDVFRDSLWQLDIEFDDWFAAKNRVVLFADTSDVPVERDWSDDETEDRGAFHEGLWILDHQSNRELDAEDYDRALELVEADDPPVVSTRDHDSEPELRL